MQRATLIQRFSNTFRGNSKLSKLLIVVTVSGGSLVAYSEATKPYQGADIGDLGDANSKRKKVVVLGTGWAATSFLKNLKDPSYDVQVISPRNYFAFTPLLPSVTSGTVEGRSIVEPIRNIIRGKNVHMHYSEAECVKIDAKNKKVYCRTNLSNEEKEEFAVDYDYLVVGVGARVNTFNIPGVVENTYFLKEVEDAQRIRRAVIDCFEKASLPNLSDEEKQRMLHFVIVGGGPTGVEFAAQLHDFVSDEVVRLYPKAKDFVKITLVEATDHVLNMFDKRITAFAEEKFKRDGIDVKTGSMVVKVSDSEISTKDAKRGEVTSTPYGMVVWSTGIGIRPVIMDFMREIGQGNRRVLATDEWLRVEGCDNVYAIGDTATINRRKVMEDIAAIFRKADKDSSGTLTVKECQEVLADVCERYPQMELYLKSKQMRSLVDLVKEGKGGDVKEPVEVDIEEFKSALSKVDTQMKNLPATAQVASQQGVYLANCFNRMEECVKNPEGPIRFRGEGRHRFHPFRYMMVSMFPAQYWIPRIFTAETKHFSILGVEAKVSKVHDLISSLLKILLLCFRYKHFGQFAPLGGEQTAAQLPGDWVSIGYGTQWLWYSVYASKQVSWRTRALVVSDWMRRFIFGRDSSQL
ncbi:external alternative NAD(P)H-ubiquinone oxidoreductase B2, mitochondrial-like isoform X1 [Ipomoea triloba]|uniref:external alternative NAD(P)H-ubiquinone oxidoreductase B2, mitochondrial-like isoform X1 n=1 Tax=Ipomoea triloba TaxID=35885 RepID=UPI00125CDCFF|nr:external alternative NAD(P)H-ubiquinone oxidoreductase B2, mitochondrial-like isoform X1 [Ipomoea triloba]XP_031129372.1 external alternative NAD(P)H-ubiquinone oxidoreductase B2, mitochondrial-like isoform X1 [Ipomoea triloba]